MSFYLWKLNTNKYYVVLKHFTHLPINQVSPTSHFLVPVWQQIIISAVEYNYLLEHHGVSQAIGYLRRKHSMSLFL